MEGRLFPLEKQLYETQFFGFPPSEFVDQGNSTSTFQSLVTVNETVSNSSLSYILKHLNYLLVSFVFIILI